MALKHTIRQVIASEAEITIQPAYPPQMRANALRLRETINGNECLNTHGISAISEAERSKRRESNDQITEPNDDAKWRDGFHVQILTYKVMNKDKKSRIG
jgi:hypothetical protein